MSRKVLLMAGLALAGTLGAFFAGRPAAGDEKPTERAGAGKHAGFVHAVVIYVKKDAPDGEDQALIDDAHELLTKIPSVRQLRAGRPAEMGTPEFGQKDYQVGLLVVFDDYEGLKTYLDHPLHQKYVGRHNKHLAKVLAFDFVDQKK